MKSIRTKMIVTALSFAVLFFAFHPCVNAQKPGTGKHEGKICDVTTFSMNKICKEWDGQWQGIGVASDGNCYFATSTHSSGHGAGFHMYNPGTKEHTVIAEDMTVICGEENSGSQQGKIHSPIVELDQITYGQTGGVPWFYVDMHGNCWFSLWKREWQYEHDSGNLYCYNVKAGKIITYHDVLPKEGQLIDGTPVTDPYSYDVRCWNWVGALPGSEKCLFALGHWGGGDERLWLFDPSKDLYNGEAFEPIAYIGSTFHETAMGGDRLYFVQYEDLEVQRTQSAELNRDEDPDIVGYNSNLHLRSISIKEGDDRTITDHGKIVDQEGRAARMINSMAADDKGCVYMTGAWYIKSDSEATLQLLLFDYPGEGLYQLMKRGEFFAVAETGTY